jgi:hypothetical protein
LYIIDHKPDEQPSMCETIVRNGPDRAELRVRVHKPSDIVTEGTMMFAQIPIINKRKPILYIDTIHGMFQVGLKVSHVNLTTQLIQHSVITKICGGDRYLVLYEDGGMKVYVVVKGDALTIRDDVSPKYAYQYIQG